MQDPGHPGRGLTRREFVRRAALVSVAAGAGAATIVGSTVGSIEATARPAPPEPMAPVAGLARLRGRTIAVGGAAGAPRVWGRLGPSRWPLLAGDEAFPEGTSLVDVDAVGDRLVAVGAVEGGRGPAPVAFASSDGETWSPVALPSQVPGLGTATSVAAREARFLFVGAAFDSPQVLEPTAPFAVEVSLDGTSRWVGGSGLPTVRHGAITMVAALADGFLLGATDVTGMRLGTGAGPGGPWAPLPPPPVQGPAAPITAATIEGATVLAVLDGLDRTSWWRRGPRTWVEIPPVVGLERGARVSALLGGRRRLIVGAVAGDRGMIEEVAA